MADRSTFLHERTQGIGGSDVASMLSGVIDVEYGCARNLHARLSGVPTDHADTETELMSLGTICEPYVRRAYAEQTGRTVKVAGFQKHGSVAALQYHDDGIIDPYSDSPRILECKAVGQEMMAKCSEESLPTDYICQVQAGCASHNLQGGVFAIAVRENILPLIAIEQAALLAGEPMPRIPRRPRIVHFEVERNEDIIRAIESEAPRFWATVGDLSKAPPRLDPDDPRCGRCPRQIWCQGEALVSSVDADGEPELRTDLNGLVLEYQTNAALLGQCEELMEATEHRIKEALGRTQAVKVQVDGKWKNLIYRLRQGRRTIDGQAMRSQYDALRRAAIEAGIVGAELAPASGAFEKVGMPSRPLLLKGLLRKKKGEVAEVETEL